MEIIHKLSNYTYQDLTNEEKVNGKCLESIANAHYFTAKFYNSSDNIRKYRNPFGIPLDKMLSKFGNHIFIDDYKESKWWVFTYKNNIFFVDIHGLEGSSIYMLKEIGSDYIYDEVFSNEMEEFYNNLFDILER